MATKGNPGKSKQLIKIVVTRDFTFTAEQVFDAWLDPVTAGRWLFATPDGEMKQVKIDARVGGTFTIVRKRPEDLVEHFGSYVEIDRPRRLVFTFGVDRHETPSKVTLDFTPTSDGCSVTLTHELDAKWAEYVERTKSGWTGILQGLSVMLDTRNELVIIRIFDAPRELVWKAWTEPNRMMRWHGPKGFTCPTCKIDFKVGGRYLSCMRADSGPEVWQKGIWGTGVYREIVPMEKIVCTDSFADENGNVVSAAHYGMEGEFPLELLVTVMFDEIDGHRTRMTLRHSGLPAGEHIKMASIGWNESLDKLTKMLK